jgi:antitoxin component HigA of HigAB toxin-antitoxin module
MFRKEEKERGLEPDECYCRGEVLREQLEELGMSANQLAAALHVPANRVTGILNETRALTPETRSGSSGTSRARPLFFG